MYCILKLKLHAPVTRAHDYVRGCVQIVQFNVEQTKVPLAIYDLKFLYKHCKIFTLKMIINRYFYLLDWLFSAMIWSCLEGDCAPPWRLELNSRMEQRYSRIKENQLDAHLILSIFRQPLHVSGVTRSIIRRYNRTYTTISTYYF